MSRKLISFLGALPIAVTLILTLAILLCIATFYESLYGTEAVQHSIYHSIGFGLLLILIGINVTCAALKKYPWKIHQVGFLITHLGIITLVGGSFISFYYGIDGRIALSPGESKNSIELSQKTVTLALHDSNKAYEIPLSVGPYVYEKELIHIATNDASTFVVDRFFPFAQPTEAMIEDPSSDFEAIELYLKSSRFEQSLWLLMNREGRVSASLGPAEITFKKVKHLKFSIPSPSSLATLHLTLEKQHDTLTLTKKDIGKILPLKNPAFRIHIKKFYSDAIVEGKKLKNRSEAFTNPALEFDILGPKGPERYVVFSLFPEFSNLHHQSSQYKAQSSLEVSDQPGRVGSLEIALDSKGKLYYHATSSRGKIQNTVILGKAYPTGWMDTTFQVKTFYKGARQQVGYMPIQVKDPNNPKVASALHFTFKDAQGQAHEDWLSFYETKSFVLNGKNYHASFMPQLLPLTFSLHLNKFNIGKDPGTKNPASYESHVTLLDKEKAQSDHKISMNEPLTHRSLTFYQSSYQTDEQGNPTATILSVGYDPGRPFKYGGSILMVFGILLLFFFRKAYIQLYQQVIKNKERNNEKTFAKTLKDTPSPI
ncbi:MAG: cytochrome c biogenesis protein ResB [Deltaproteobacteria bacterium]|nr:cytochrome c biogenesis protein ResB [Deltaproteobacteria bacterium]